MAVEIMEFPIKNGDFPKFFVCLPEGTYYTLFIWHILALGCGGGGLRGRERCLRDESLGRAAEGAEPWGF